MIHITAERLENVVEKVFVGAGVPRDRARRVAHSLVESNLVGHASHGVLRVDFYEEMLDTFCELVDDLIEATKNAQKAQGVKEILVPGEYEWKNRAQHMEEGLDLPDATWQRIVDTGKKYGVSVTVKE